MIIFFSRKAAALLTLVLLIAFSYGFKTFNNKSSGTNKGKTSYLPGTVIVKLKTNISAALNKSVSLSSTLNKVLSPLGLSSSKKLFTNSSNKEQSSLDKILILHYSSNSDPLEVSSKLKELTEVEWAEPDYIYHPAFVPDDSLYVFQWNLSKINAEQAWDITKGDTSIVIGIVDTGVDWPHPDLAANMWVNWGEIPDNGIDDDHNGFIDDYHGWDFGGLNGTPDNNPIEDRPDHGTFVAGVASGVTNNKIGIASIGFKSKLMAVKVSQDNLRDKNGNVSIPSSNVFNGIRYAADNGAKIINLSLGGDGYSILGQETIDYATLKGALVVAAAGNDGNSNPFYPASYKGVISAASTDQDDQRSSFSNYGSNVDVAAPGRGITSTWYPDTYLSGGSGTSFSSPLTAGLAALVKAHFPNYAPLQVGEQIRVNCDNIDSMNTEYIYMLGGGRLNAYKALSSTSSKSVRAVDIVLSDEAPGGNNDGIYLPGETISVDIKFKNYLNPTNNLSITLISGSSYAAVQNGTFNVGAVATLDSFYNSSSRFKFKLNNTLPNDTTLNFVLNYKDGSYNDFQTFGVLVNPSYATQNGNDIALTITSKGNIAFNDYPVNEQGDGFKYQNGNSLLYEGALMLGISSTLVEDAARGTDQIVQDADFSVSKPFIINTPGSVADIQGSTDFNDDKAGAKKLGISIKLQSYTYTSDTNKNYIILRYSLTNSSSKVISNLYAGLFLDWDLIDGNNDVSDYDNANGFGYAYHIGDNFNTRVGAGLISSGASNFWSILNPGGDGGFSIYDGFSTSEKWQALSGGLTKTNAGPGDISQVISGGPYTIQPGATVDAAFALAAGIQQSDLQNAIARAKIKYQSIITSVENDKDVIPYKFSLEQNYPNPFNPSTKIKYSVPSSDGYGGTVMIVNLKVYDILGNEIVTLVNEEKPSGKYEVEFNGKSLSSGTYFYKITIGSYSAVKKMILIK